VTVGLPAGDLRILDLLTASEAALELRLPVDTVRSLAAAGVLVRVPFGRQARFTPESVAAYGQRLTAGEVMPGVQHD
jgi:excisionase family DNA binding protein